MEKANVCMPLHHLLAIVVEDKIDWNSVYMKKCVESSKRSTEAKSWAEKLLRVEDAHWRALAKINRPTRGLLAVLLAVVFFPEVQIVGFGGRGHHSDESVKIKSVAQVRSAKLAHTG